MVRSDGPVFDEPSSHRISATHFLTLNRRGENDKGVDGWHGKGGGSLEVRHLLLGYLEILQSPSFGSSSRPLSVRLQPLRQGFRSREDLLDELDVAGHDLEVERLAEVARVDGLRLIGPGTGHMHGAPREGMCEHEGDGNIAILRAIHRW